MYICISQFKHYYKLTIPLGSVKNSLVFSYQCYISGVSLILTRGFLAQNLDQLGLGLIQVGSTSSTETGSRL
jgi:hypothetical protein